MGKRQHQKDKMYLTYTEWTTLYGGKKSGHSSKEEENFKRLPFDHCCLSLQPFDIPYCDLDGNIFDLEALLPFLKKFKINPVTGKPLELKYLIKLNIHKNSEGEFECPVLFKPFTKSSYIAAIATTGNVFLMEAIEQLNIKNRNWKDLITDKPFERKDIIILQDPNNLLKFNISKFHHVKNNLRVETEEEIIDKSNPQANLKSINMETKYTLEELNRDYRVPTIEINSSASTAKADKFNAAHYSTGEVAASFTSTAMNRKLIHEAAIVHEDEVRYQRVKKKVAHQYQERNATDGGSEPPGSELDYLDKDMLNIIEKTSIIGIPGGFDSMKPVASHQVANPLPYSHVNPNTFEVPVISIEKTEQIDFSPIKVAPNEYSGETCEDKSTQTDFSTVQDQLLQQGQQQLEFMRRQTLAQESMVQLFEEYLRSIRAS